MLKQLKEEVCEANKELIKRQIVIYTWGNVSGIDRSTGLMVIKPSGVDYDKMVPEDMVVVDIMSGEIIEGDLKPSSDTPTHIELYKRYLSIGGITHTHSINAVSFAQAGLAIPILGTTHSDYFYGDIPCTRSLNENEMKEYEKNTGKVICETIDELKYDPMTIPAILVNNHGPFSWGKCALESVHNSVVLEQVAEMAIKTIALNKNSTIPRYIVDKHYLRKHGSNAYYGQQ